jgi:Phosphotransferase system IIC components, glucose/maltose/N-acetylglucosamine-specific
MTIRDYDKVDMEKLKAIDGVLGVVQEDTLQVVVGPGLVNKVAQVMIDQVGVKLGQEFPKDLAEKTEESNMTEHQKAKAEVTEKAAEFKAQQKKKIKPSKTKAVLKSISNIFVPLIPVFVGAGLIGGIAAVLSNYDGCWRYR